MIFSGGEAAKCLTPSLKDGPQNLAFKKGARHADLTFFTQAADPLGTRCGAADFSCHWLFLSDDVTSGDDRQGSEATVGAELVSGPRG